MNQKITVIVGAVVCSLFTLVNSTFAQGTAFTYQGRLNAGGNPVNGNYDFTFAMFNNSSTNSGQAGTTLTDLDVGVTNGLFTVTLDFGANFPGANRWLAIGVRSNGTTSFTAISPLQDLTPTPYAIYSANAGSATTATSASSASSVAASGISGMLSLVNLPASVVTNTEIGVTLSGALSGTFSGNGAGLTSLNASQLSSGVVPNGVLPGFQASSEYSTIGGGQGNVVIGPWATIAGGNNNTNNNPTGTAATIAGGQNNIITNGLQAAIGGGFGNFANGNYATVPGGIDNVANGTAAAASGFKNQALSGGAVVSGGGNNIASGLNSSVGGGSANQATQQGAAVAGGYNNTNSGFYATIPGGFQNLATGSNSLAAGSFAHAVNQGAFVWSDSSSSTSFSSVVNNSFNVRAMGGMQLTTGGAGIVVDGQYALTGVTGPNDGENLFNLNAQAISGVIQNSSLPGFQGPIYGAVGGGSGNTASGQFATVGGGENNTGSGFGVVVGGGNANQANGGLYATIPGGQQNVASGDYSFAAGFKAQATNDGAFVWADSQGTFFASTNNNSFNVRAGGGVYFVTGSAGFNISGPLLSTGAGANSGSSAALGYGCLQKNTTGQANTAVGFSALSSNTTGAGNTGVGGAALFANLNGGNNTGIGENALLSLTNGSEDTALGDSALFLLLGGTNNTALGANAGYNFTGNENNNIDIGNSGVAGESGIIRIGTAGMHTATFVAGNVGLGGVTSPQQTLSLNGGMNVDQSSLNTGTTANALLFGSSSGEGVGSVRTNGHGDSFGLNFYTDFNKRMTILQNGNVGIGTTNATQLLVVGSGGAYCNGTTWVNGSDRNSKQGFSAVSPREVLDKVSALPITEWQYKVDAEGTTHIGPMAQDFHAAFGLNGGDDKHISTVDEGGVALAAIQGLNEKLTEKESEIRQLQQSVIELKAMVLQLTQSKAK